MNKGKLVGITGDCRIVKKRNGQKDLIPLANLRPLAQKVEPIELVKSMGH